MSTNYKQSKVGRGIDLYINDNDYIKIGKNGNDITIRCDDCVLNFDNFKEMITSFKPGCIEKSRNLNKLSLLKFDENTKNNLYTTEVYDLEEMCSYKLLIIARNEDEAEVLLGNYVIDLFDEAEVDPIYEIDKSDIDESFNKYIDKGIGVYYLNE